MFNTHSSTMFSVSTFFSLSFLTRPSGVLILQVHPVSNTNDLTEKRFKGIHISQGMRVLEQRYCKESAMLVHLSTAGIRER